MNSQARIPDSQARETHAKNAQAACKKLEEFTAALDTLMAQLDVEKELYSQRDRPSIPGKS